MACNTHFKYEGTNISSQAQILIQLGQLVAYLLISSLPQLSTALGKWIFQQLQASRAQQCARYQTRVCWGRSTSFLIIIIFSSLPFPGQGTGQMSELDGKGLKWRNVGKKGMEWRNGIVRHTGDAVTLLQPHQMHNRTWFGSEKEWMELFVLVWEQLLFAEPSSEPIWWNFAQSQKAIWV